MSTNSINGNTLLTSGSFPPVRVASTGAPLNPTTGGLLIVDGVQLAAGDRVLCKDETSPVNNGIYAANTGPWVRTTDASGNQHFFSGMAVTVGLGAVNAGLTYICTCTDDPVIVGASLLTFVAQSVVATATQTATSASSNVIGTGTKVFTIQSGKAFRAGQWVLVQNNSAAGNMLAQIVSYIGTTLTLSVVSVSDAGNFSANWTIVLANSPASAGQMPPIGTGDVTGPGSSTTGHMATFADTTGLVIQDGGLPVGGANTITPSMFASAAVALGFNMLNGTLVATSTDANTSLTIAVKTLAGADPSASDPVFFLFRSATPGSAGYSIVEVTAALSTKIPSGSTLAFGASGIGKVWIAAVNNTGTASLAVMNCLIATATATSIYPLAGWGIAPNVTGYGAGASTAQVLYGTSTIGSPVPYSVLGYFTYEAGTPLGSPGTWATTPSRMELYRPGVALPGQLIQPAASITGAVATDNTTMTLADTVPTNTQGGQYLSLAITPSSSANLLEIEAQGSWANNNASPGHATMALFQDATANALTAVSQAPVAQNDILTLRLKHRMQAGTISSTTFKIREGGSNGTNTFNGVNAARENGGVFNSWIEAREIAA